MSDSTKAVHARAQAIKAKLLAYARNQALPYERVLTLFQLERAAYRLLLDPKLANSLVFKGGYINVRVYASTRYTTDLDAIVRNLDQATAADRVLRVMQADIDDGVWFSLQETIELKLQNIYGGVRFVFRAGLGPPPPKIEKAQIIHFDMGTGDPVTPAPRYLQTPLTVGDGELSWLVYPLETILSEKLHTLADRGGGNSRSKDIYDLFLLLPRAKRDVLRQALEATFNYRSSVLVLPLSETIKQMNFNLLRAGWNTAVVGIHDAPTFENSIESIINTLREMSL